MFALFGSGIEGARWVSKMGILKKCHTVWVRLSRGVGRYQILKILDLPCVLTLPWKKDAGLCANRVGVQCP